jgi:hypothetical protein
MDDNTRDTYALLNAYRFLLEALYLEAVGTNPDSIERMRSYVLKRIEEPYILPSHDPNATQEALEIRPKTAEIVEGFFQAMYPPLRSQPDLKALSKPNDNDPFPF